MTTEGCQTKPKIDYPCPWLFKVIGFDRQEIEQVIAEIVGGIPFTVTTSNASSGGRYQSVNLEMEVTSEENRDSIYQNLAAHSAIKVVL